MRHNLLGKRVEPDNGVAQGNLNLKRPTVERLKCGYERPLPVTVEVTYKLSGRPISGSDIKDKSGNVEVDYQLTNATAKPVKVCLSPRPTRPAGAVTHAATDASGSSTAVGARCPWRPGSQTTAPSLRPRRSLATS